MVDQLLGGLFGGQDDDDDTRRQGRARDFVSRYETGAPHEGYSDEEAVHNYRQVAGRLSPQEYEEAAAETFGRLSPQERKQLKRQMKERSGGRLADDDDANDDPRRLARMASRYREQDSGGGGLAGLFGMGGGGNGGDLMDAARGGGGGMLDNPLAKVAMGGIAAVAMKKMMGR